MSFEGYYQILCKNGHETCVDCYEYPHFGKEETDDFGTKYPWKCYCGTTAAWWNLVDQTNGSHCTACDGIEECKWCIGGRIDGYVALEEETPSESCQCDKCGNSHLAKSATYKVPSKPCGHHVKGDEE